MTLVLVIWFAAGALVDTLYRTDRREVLDPLPCHAEPSTTYRYGEPGYRVARRGDYHSLLHCLPKEECFLASNGDAVCWRVATLKHRKS